MLTIIVLAGGFATRLKPLTEKIPKSLVDVCGLPFIIHQLRYFKSQGISKVVLCTGHLGFMIENLLQNQDFGMQIIVENDGPLKLGTGGALKKAIKNNWDFIGNEFLITYEDSYLNKKFKKIHNFFLKKKNK